MSFLEDAKKRFSVRSFINKPIPEETLDYMLECARVAPSAANRQAYVIYVLKEGEIRELVNETYPRAWIKQAPVLLVICENRNTSWKHSKTHDDFARIDATIAIDHITLAAAEKKIGTCWICHFDIDKCAEILDVTMGIIPFALLPLGYTNEQSDLNRHSEKRLTISDIVKTI